MLALALTGGAGAGALPQAAMSLPPTPVWGPNVLANTDNSGFGQHEPNLAASPIGQIVQALAVSPAFATDRTLLAGTANGLFRSTDGGQTWPTQLHMPGLPPDIPLQSDPVVVARDDGRIYVVALGYSDGYAGHGLFITWSDDGVNFVPSVPITYNETPGSLDDKEWLG
ncbi:MAG: hypothetical protein C4309_00260, partial [Chloroflexota bacterium]